MINNHYAKLPASYLFSEVAKRVRAYQQANPDAKLLRLGIGDVTRPLPTACIKALLRASDEMGRPETFRGYGPEQGYDFLREAISAHDYLAFGASIMADEIFIGDGAKSDCANIQELFDLHCVVAVADPVYPVYVDSNAMAGRIGDYTNGRWSNLIYLPCVPENGFIPSLPETKVDLIYLCYPNNPTGATLTHDQLKQWVDYAARTGAVLLYDAAYRAYISRPETPRSIYEIDGAQEVAIEFGSFSKTAGFTGLRCSYTVVPKALKRDGISLHAMWLRRQTTKFNGTPYIVQRAAEAVYSPEGKRQVAELIEYYMQNASMLRQVLVAAGIQVCGGIDAPYLWFPCPKKMDSWAFFDRLLQEAQIIGTPGVGFGPSGAECFRLTAFGSHEDTIQAVARLRKVL